MATMQDVARRAQVSVTTVSRVLNHDQRVKRETRERVEKIMALLEYETNLTARSLRQHSSHVIGLVVDTLRNPFTAELSQEVAVHLKDSGYELILANTERDEDQGRFLLKVLAQRGVDGILYAAGWGRNAEILAVECGVLWHEGIPTIMVGNALATVPSVAVDHTRGIGLGVRYLYELGHRRVAYVSGAPNTSTTELRRTGFIQAAEQYGLDASPIFDGHGLLPGAAEITREILHDHSHPTAILVASDYLAMGVLHGLNDLRCHIPQDMSVVGFDNILSSQFMCPALTTVDASINAMAAMACAKLISARTNPGREIPSDLLEPRLIDRDSAAPPKHVPEGTGLNRH